MTSAIEHSRIILAIQRDLEHFTLQQKSLRVYLESADLDFGEHKTLLDLMVLLDENSEMINDCLTFRKTNRIMN